MDNCSSFLGSWDDPKLQPGPCSALANGSQIRFNYAVEFHILGPLAVRADGEDVVLGGRKPRALVAALLLHANEVVSRDALIDALWDERVPASAGHTLDGYLSRLRRAIGHDRVVTTAPATCSGSNPASSMPSGSRNWRSAVAPSWRVGTP